MSKRAKQNSSSKHPWIAFYYKDWLSDHRLNLVSPATRGIWMDLIAASCDLDKKGVFFGKKNPLSVEEILKLARGKTAEKRKAFDELLKYDVIKQDEAGTFYVKRVKGDAEISDVKRDNGLKGGNPVLLNQEVNQEVKQAIAVLSSPSISESLSKSDIDIDSMSKPQGYSLIDELRRKQEAAAWWIKQIVHDPMLTQELVGSKPNERRLHDAFEQLWDSCSEERWEEMQRELITLLTMMRSKSLRAPLGYFFNSLKNSPFNVDLLTYRREGQSA